VDYIFVRLSLTELPANNLKRISTMYVQGYLQGSENGRVVTIVSLDASYQVSDNLAMRFQRRYFRNRPIRNKNHLWWPCLSMDRDGMSNMHRGPSIDDSY
jgi:hypothetical protein